MAFDGLGIDKDFLNSGIPMNMGNLDGVQDMINKMPGEQQDDISRLFEKEMGDVGGPVSFKLWMKIISLQKEFNSRVAPGWETDTEQEQFNYWTAILDETMEVVGSKHWKWWKDKDKLNTIDWENVNVEMVDLFHFILSISLQFKHQDTIFMTLIAYEKQKEDNQLKGKEDFFDDFWMEFLMAVWQKSLPLIIVKWCEFFYRSGADFKSLTRDYFIKNALNHIRQEFGYASGKYKKMWPSLDSSVQEDNVVAGLLLKEKFNDPTEDSFEEMTQILRLYYLEHIAV